MAGGDWRLELWALVIASGLYHGLSPGMGWPLAVSAALMEGARERRGRAFLGALGALAAGHFAAMAVVLLPFGLLTMLVAWSREIRIAAALALILFGLGLLIYRRHPRALARIKPSRLMLWSFAIAMAHGAGLMLVPIYLGLCTREELQEIGHQAALTLMAGNLAMALAVALVHTMAMIAAGGLIAWLVFRTLGLKFISASWLNLDALWATSLVLVGALALWAAY